MTQTKTQKKVCKFYNTGYCKHQGACKFLHPIEKCERSCSKSSCPKRHPKPCRYGDKCRRKDICEYKHETSSTENDLKAEVKALKITIKLLQDESKDTKDKLDHLENELSVVKEKLGTKAEKDKTKVEVPEQTESVSTQARIEEEHTDDKDGLSLDEIIRENSIQFKCDFCDHSFKTKLLLKKHEVRYHPSDDAGEVFSADCIQNGKKGSKTFIKCSLCEFKTNQTKTQSQAQVDKIQDHLKTKHDLSLDTDYYIWFEDEGTPATGSSCSGYLHIED